MLERIAVTLRCRRHQIPGVVFLRDIERVKCADRPDLQRGDAVDSVVHGAGRAGEVKNVIDLAHVEGLANILVDEFQPRVVGKMGKVGKAAGEQVIDDDHAPAFAEQGIAEMRAEKSGTAGD